MGHWRHFASEGVFLKRKNGILQEQLANLYLLNKTELIRVLFLLNIIPYCLIISM